MQTLVHTIRLFPNKEQKAELIRQVSLRNTIWNRLILVQQKAYSETKKILSDFALMRILTSLKETYPELKSFNSKAAQVVAKQVGMSYRSFFQLIKNKDFKAQPPNLIPEDKLVSITFNQSGWSFKEAGILFSKFTSPIRFKGAADYSKDNIKEVRIKFKNNKWLCDFVIENEDEFIQNCSNKVLAIDLGLDILAKGVDSTGKVITLLNKAKKISKYFGNEISKIDTKLKTKKRGSRKDIKLRQVRKDLYRRQHVQVSQALHIQSKQLANMNYQTIVLGDLSVKQLMSRETNNKRGVRKSFHQSSIDTFRQFLSYKAQGKTNVIEIDERHTTQLNCLSGKKFEEHIELSQREVQVSDNIVIDRDLNSAINIMKRYESHHLAAMTPPLDISRVLEANNLKKALK